MAAPLRFSAPSVLLRARRRANASRVRTTAARSNFLGSVVQRISEGVMKGTDRFRIGKTVPRAPAKRGTGLSEEKLSSRSQHLPTGMDAVETSTCC
jgi:hypothetical protein